jgi:glycosyltransferase involved in cell wall biosynthesis
MSPEPDRLTVLIVASWYPGVDDPARGRFVADQAEALADTGRAEPFIASFESVNIDGDRLVWEEGLRVFEERRSAALDAHPAVVSRLAWSVPVPIGVARVPTLFGIGRAAPGGSDGELRRAALMALAERLDLAGRVGVVHAHTAYPDGFAAAALARQLGWPLVVTEHATFVARQLGRPEERRRYLEAVDAADRFLAVSDGLAGELAEALPELEGKLEVMPNTVPLEHYVASGLEGRNLEELLFVGYRKPIKGIPTLLRAFHDVRNARPGATLRLIGRSPSIEVEEQWIQLAEDLGVLDAVHFDEPLDRAGVAAAMSRAGVLVHPSIRETFGMTTIEALASGLPVVAARWGGISGILEDPRLGEVVPLYDSRALSRAVLRVLDRRESFDPAYLRAAVEPYAATTVARRLVGLYERLVAERQTTPATLRGRLPLQGSGAPVPERLLVVGRDTRRAVSLLRDMPPELRARIFLVTAGLDEDGEPMPLPAGLAGSVATGRRIARELGRVGLLGPRGNLADRTRRAARNPVAALRRRIRAANRSRMRTRAVLNGMRAGLQHAATVAFLRRGPAGLVCIDAIDYEATAAIAARADVTQLPGGPTWLGDAWVSGQAAASETPSRSSTASAIRSPTTAQS